MNCPECGRFMKLEFAREIGRDAMESAYWWICTNDDCIQADYGLPIPALEYDWTYWHEGIPQEDLETWPGLKAEYDEALRRYLNRPSARQRGSNRIGGGDHQ